MVMEVGPLKPGDITKTMSQNIGAGRKRREKESKKVDPVQLFKHYGYGGFFQKFGGTVADLLGKTALQPLIEGIQEGTDWMTDPQDLKRARFLMSGIGEDDKGNPMLLGDVNNTQYQAHLKKLDNRYAEHESIRQRGFNNNLDYKKVQEEYFVNNMMDSYRDKLAKENPVGYDSTAITDSVLSEIIKRDINTPYTDANKVTKSRFDRYYEQVENFDTQYKDMIETVPIKNRAAIAKLLYTGAGNRITQMFRDEAKDRNLNIVASDLLKYAVDGSSEGFRASLSSDKQALFDKNRELQTLALLLKETADVSQIEDNPNFQVMGIKAMNDIQNRADKIEDDRILEFLKTGDATVSPKTLRSRIEQLLTKREYKKDINVSGDPSKGIIVTQTITNVIDTPFGKETGEEDKLIDANVLWDSNDPGSKQMIGALEKSSLYNLGYLSRTYLTPAGFNDANETIYADFNANPNNKLYQDERGGVLTFNSVNKTRGQYRYLMDMIDIRRRVPEFSQALAESENKAWETFYSIFSKNDSNITKLTAALVPPKQFITNNESGAIIKTDFAFRKDGTFDIRKFYTEGNVLDMTTVPATFKNQIKEVFPKDKTNDKIEDIFNTLRGNHVEYLDAFEEIGSAFEAFKNVQALNYVHPKGEVRKYDPENEPEGAWMTEPRINKQAGGKITAPLPSLLQKRI